MSRAEIGLDLSREFPKRLTDDGVRAAAVVITWGCGDARPVYSGKRYLDWVLVVGRARLSHLPQAQRLLA